MVKNKKLTKKVYSRVTPETYRRLEDIRIAYGFNSVYEIVQSLIHCFLRVADSKSDTQMEPVPYDIEMMFSEMAEAERHVEFRKPKRRIGKKSIDDNLNRK